MFKLSLADQVFDVGLDAGVKQLLDAGKRGLIADQIPREVRLRIEVNAEASLAAFVGNAGE